MTSKFLDENSFHMRCLAAGRAPVLPAAIQRPSVGEREREYESGIERVCVVVCVCVCVCVCERERERERE